MTTATTQDRATVAKRRVIQSQAVRAAVEIILDVTGETHDVEYVVNSILDRFDGKKNGRTKWLASQEPSFKYLLDKVVGQCHTRQAQWDSLAD